MTLGRTPTSSNLRGAVAGIIAGGVALGVAQLVAGLISSSSSPVVAVGQLSIDFAPPPVKDFAISAFGSHDKIVLVGGILVVLALFAAAIGIAAVRRPAWGMTGLGLFILVGIIAALTRPHASASDAMPTLIGGVAAALALRRLARLAAPPPPLPSSARPARPGYTPPGAGPVPPGLPGSGASSGTGTAEPGITTPGGTTPDDTSPDTAEQPAVREEWRPYLPGKPAVPAGASPAGPAGPSGPRAPATRPPLPGPQRRSFLTSSAVLAGSAVVAGLGGRLLSEHGNVAAVRKTLRIPPPARPAPPLPAGADLKIPGLSSFITPNATFYRVDTAIVLPEITPDAWQLRIHGMVARPVTLTYRDLLKRPLLEDYITLTCVSDPVQGPYVGNAKWLGVSVRSLLREAGIRAGADQLLCTSADGFTCGTPIQTSMDGRDSMLAVAMNGQPLPVAHGFPVRMVVPGLYGYVSACKWIRHRGHHFRPGARLLDRPRLEPAGADQDRVPDRRARLVLAEGRAARRGRGGLGPAQGHRGRRGARRQGPLAPGPARRRARHRYLAAVGLGVGRGTRQPPHRVPRHRPHRLYPDRAGGPARAQRRQRLPAGRGQGQLSRAQRRSRGGVTAAGRGPGRTCRRRASGPSH
ncbi:MAG TPA: molybdopterin-dependent oxidoreductase [Streptosporangiaceae bacterium]